mgnify:CR=1 FL=1
MPSIAEVSAKRTSCRNGLAMENERAVGPSGSWARTLKAVFHPFGTCG